MSVERFARSDVVTAAPDAPIHELATTMRESTVGSVVIVDGDEPVGIVTDRDLTTRVLAERADPEDLVAEDVMSPELRTIDRDADFYRATETMNNHSVRRLPVVDEGDSLVGIITVDDLSELVADEHGELVGILREQRPPY